VKTSAGKRTIPGAKQIYRRYSKNGELEEDILALEDEEPPFGTVPLLVKVLHRGRLVCDLPSIELTRDKARKDVATLPARYRTLTGSLEPPMRLSPKLEKLTNTLWTTRGEPTG
jgi:nicotinate phosphoribosyltransferase